MTTISALQTHNVRPFKAYSSHSHQVVRRLLRAQAAARDLDPLLGSQALAAKWAREQTAEQPLFIDPYAAALAGQALDQQMADEWDYRDELTTRWIDEQLIEAASQVNMDRKQEYRQIVMLGCGLDTRPFRLQWQPGTLLFVVAPAEVHEVAAVALQGLQAHVPRGCLLRRVPAPLQTGEGFADALSRAGFRANRLSIWGLQGICALGLDIKQLKAVLTDVTNMAAFNSIVLGELPAMHKAQAEDLLGEFGLLGQLLDFADERLRPLRGSHQQQVGAAGEVPRWLFTSQHQRLSLAEMDTYAEHSQAAHETDEDFFDNFS